METAFQPDFSNRVLNKMAEAPQELMHTIEMGVNGMKKSVVKFCKFIENKVNGVDTSVKALSALYDGTESLLQKFVSYAEHRSFADAKTKDQKVAFFKNVGVKSAVSFGGNAVWGVGAVNEVTNYFSGYAKFKELYETKGRFAAYKYAIPNAIGTVTLSILSLSGNTAAYVFARSGGNVLRQAGLAVKTKNPTAITTACAGMVVGVLTEQFASSIADVRHLGVDATFWQKVVANAQHWGVRTALVYAEAYAIKYQLRRSGVEKDTADLLSKSFRHGAFASVSAITLYHRYEQFFQNVDMKLVARKIGDELMKLTVSGVAYAADEAHAGGDVNIDNHIEKLELQGNLQEVKVEHIQEHYINFNIEPDAAGRNPELGIELRNLKNDLERFRVNGTFEGVDPSVAKLNDIVTQVLTPWENSTTIPYLSHEQYYQIIDLYEQLPRSGYPDNLPDVDYGSLWTHKLTMDSTGKFTVSVEDCFKNIEQTTDGYAEANLMLTMQKLITDAANREGISTDDLNKIIEYGGFLSYGYSENVSGWNGIANQIIIDPKDGVRGFMVRNFGQDLAAYKVIHDLTGLQYSEIVQDVRRFYSEDEKYWYEKRFAEDYKIISSEILERASVASKMSEAVGGAISAKEFFLQLIDKIPPKEDLWTSLHNRNFKFDNLELYIQDAGEYESGHIVKFESLNTNPFQHQFNIHNILLSSGSDYTKLGWWNEPHDFKLEVVNDGSERYYELHAVQKVSSGFFGLFGGETENVVMNVRIDTEQYGSIPGEHIANITDQNGHSMSVIFNVTNNVPTIVSVVPLTDTEPNVRMIAIPNNVMEAMKGKTISLEPDKDGVLTIQEHVMFRGVETTRTLYNTNTSVTENGELTKDNLIKFASRGEGNTIRTSPENFKMGEAYTLKSQGGDGGTPDTEAQPATGATPVIIENTDTNEIKTIHFNGDLKESGFELKNIANIKINTNGDLVTVSITSAEGINVSSNIELSDLQIGENTLIINDDSGHSVHVSFNFTGNRDVVTGDLIRFEFLEAGDVVQIDDQLNVVGTTRISGNLNDIGFNESSQVNTVIINNENFAEVRLITSEDEMVRFNLPYSSFTVGQNVVNVTDDANHTMVVVLNYDGDNTISTDDVVSYEFITRPTDTAIDAAETEATAVPTSEVGTLSPTETATPTPAATATAVTTGTIAAANPVESTATPLPTATSVITPTETMTATVNAPEAVENIADTGIVNYVEVPFIERERGILPSFMYPAEGFNSWQMVNGLFPDHTRVFEYNGSNIRGGIYAEAVLSETNFGDRFHIRLRDDIAYLPDANYTTSELFLAPEDLKPGMNILHIRNDETGDELLFLADFNPRVGDTDPSLQINDALFIDANTALILPSQPLGKSESNPLNIDSVSLVYSIVDDESKAFNIFRAGKSVISKYSDYIFGIQTLNGLGSMKLVEKDFIKQQVFFVNMEGNKFEVIQMKMDQSFDKMTTTAIGDYKNELAYLIRDYLSGVKDTLPSSALVSAVLTDAFNLPKPESVNPNPDSTNIELEGEGANAEFKLLSKGNLLIGLSILSIASALGTYIFYRRNSKEIKTQFSEVKKIGGENVKKQAEAFRKRIEELKDKSVESGRKIRVDYKLKFSSNINVDIIGVHLKSPNLSSYMKEERDDGQFYKVLDTAINIQPQIELEDEIFDGILAQLMHTKFFMLTRKQMPAESALHNAIDYMIKGGLPEDKIKLIIYDIFQENVVALGFNQNEITFNINMDLITKHRY